MYARRFFLFLFIFIGFLLPLNGAEVVLTPLHVREAMEQLFEYHVDRKEMSPVVLERSLKIYLKQFDPSYAYLLQDETTPYMKPTAHSLNMMMKDYAQDKLTSFFSLNNVIQTSIQRARGWRVEWEKNPKQLVADALALKPETTLEKEFATSIPDLKKRQRDRFVRFLALQLHELSPDGHLGKENKIVALCEKQIALLENTYLGLDDQGKGLSAAKQQHLVVMRTLKALAHSLDAHTAYYSPDEAYAMKVQLEKGMCGIGVVLREGVDGVTIHEMVKDGPAEKSGKLMAGDRIIEVDGLSVKDLSFHRVLEVMRGKEGTKTILGIARTNVQKPLHVELTRSKITLADKRVDVSSEPFGNGIIGKITLHSFYEGDDGISSEVDLKKAIDELKAQGQLHGLVLDMRENSGGFLSQAVKVSGLFISSGVVLISKYSDGSVKYYRTVDGERYFDGPLAILISRGSASATEIVAQTLRDYGVAIIVGDEQTYGKGTIQHQTVTSTKANSFFKVTIGRYYTVSGKSTQIEGVKADIVVPTEYHFEEMGERYLDFPLPADTVAAAFNDPLADIDPFARKWFYKYYVPKIQATEEKWVSLIPLLQANSEKRVAQNKNYQSFLKKAESKEKNSEKIDYGTNDLQMDEAVDIVKDMIFFSESGLVNHD